MEVRISQVAAGPPASCGQRAGVPVNGQWRGVMGLSTHPALMCRLICVASGQLQAAVCTGRSWILGRMKDRGSEARVCIVSPGPLTGRHTGHCRRNVPPVPTTATSSHIGACSDLTRYRRSSKVTFLILPFPDLFLVSAFHCRPQWRYDCFRVHGDLWLKAPYEMSRVVLLLCYAD